MIEFIDNLVGKFRKREVASPEIFIYGVYSEVEFLDEYLKVMGEIARMKPDDLADRLRENSSRFGLRDEDVRRLENIREISGDGRKAQIIAMAAYKEYPYRGKKGIFLEHELRALWKGRKERGEAPLEPELLEERLREGIKKAEEAIGQKKVDSSSQLMDLINVMQGDAKKFFKKIEPYVPPEDVPPALSA